MSALRPPRPPDDRYDLTALAAAHGIDLPAALDGLDAFYRDVGERIEQGVTGVDLPCGRGCAGCCKDSVFLTPLEFLGAWDHLQRTVEPEVLRQVIESGLAAYAENREVIASMSRSSGSGLGATAAVARGLHFDCPMLDAQGACRIYARRNLDCRLFGSTLGVLFKPYACDLATEPLAKAPQRPLDVWQASYPLKQMPLTQSRQTYPFYIHALYGAAPDPAVLWR